MYTPSLAHLDETPNDMAYSPSLSDIAQKNEPMKLSELFKNIRSKDPFLSSYSTNPEERENASKVYQQRRAGAAQSLANYPIEIANLFRENPINKFNFAPNTPEAKAGGMAGDVASFFMPGGAARGIIKGASYLPKVGEAINALTKSSQASPLLNSLTKIGETGGQAALYGATKNPDNKEMAALESGGVGSATQAAVNLLTSRNPIINLLARLGVGTAAGSAVGHPVAGAAAGAAFPQVASLFGLGNNKTDLLEGLNYKDIARAKLANDRLGTAITPAQASGNYVTAGLEGNLKRTPQAAQVGYRLEQNQARQQKNAINNMLDNIYKPTPESEAKINSLYTKAEQKDINPLSLDEWKENPIVQNAFKTVRSIPAYKNVPETNYKYLAEVDRQLFRDQKAAEGNKPNVAYAVSQVKNAFNNFLKENNTDYEAATRAAQPKMVRNDIESRFNKNEEDFTGKNFYNKFLNTRKSYQDVIKNTANFPEAQQALKDMRQGWKHLSNIKTVSQGEAQAKTGIADARDQLKVIWNAMKTLSGAKKDVAGLKFVYSPDWDKEFANIAKVKQQSERNRKLATLLGKMSIAAGLDTNS